MLSSKLNYLKNLPTKRIAVGCLFFNSREELLILKTSYTKNWTIPGGCLNKGESPLEGLRREIKEEIGVELEIKKCLIIDSKKEIIGNYEDESLQIIFIGKKLNKNDIAKIKIDANEITEFKFKKIEEALKLLNLKIAKRIKSLNNDFNQCILTENGKRVL